MQRIQTRNYFSFKELQLPFPFAVATGKECPDGADCMFLGDFFAALRRGLPWGKNGYNNYLWRV
jgi:hypothetical protein